MHRGKKAKKSRVSKRNRAQHRKVVSEPEIIPVQVGSGIVCQDLGVDIGTGPSLDQIQQMHYPVINLTVTLHTGEQSYTRRFRK